MRGNEGGGAYLWAHIEELGQEEVYDDKDDEEEHEVAGPGYAIGLVRACTATVLGNRCHILCLISRSGWLLVCRLLL